MSKRHAPEEPNQGAGPLFTPLIGLENNLPGRMLKYEPPPHNGTPTSKAAAKSIESKAATMRGRVLAFVLSRGPIGATREDIELRLKMGGSTVRPRVVELLKLGTLRETDVTRATSSGRRAVVLVAT